MRPGEVFRLAFTGRERVHQTDCVHGIPMMASAIRDVHAVLSGALQQAVVWGWRTDNPARSATPPCRSHDTRMARQWLSDHVARWSSSCLRRPSRSSRAASRTRRTRPVSASSALALSSLTAARMASR